jgi:hypothetical protein
MGGADDLVLWWQSPPASAQAYVDTAFRLIPDPLQTVLRSRRGGNDPRHESDMESLTARASPHEPRWRRSLSLAVVALVAGYALYAVARPFTHSLVLFHVAMPLPALPRPWSWLLGSAPSFLHTLAFCVLLALAVGGDRQRRLLACLVWFAVEIVAEVAQHPAVGLWARTVVPELARSLPVRSLLAGTFDVADLVAVASGAALAAWCVSNRER